MKKDDLKAFISLISVIFILLIGMMMSGCASMMGASGHMANSLNYVRQHKGEGLRRPMAGSEAELMDMAVKSMEKANYTIIREPHAVLARYPSTDLSYAFYFYPSQTNNQTEVEVLIASPWLTAEQMRKFQEQAFSTFFVSAAPAPTALTNGHTQLQKAWLGVSMQDIKEKKGVLVNGVFPGDPADKAGVKVGDVILEVNRQPINTGSELARIISLFHPGDNVHFMIRRDKKSLFVNIKLADRPEVLAEKSREFKSYSGKSDVDELPVMQAKPNKNAYAIVIGVEKYRQKLPKVDYADHDARIMAEYLTKVMGYPEENIVTLINDRALKSDLEKYIGRWLPNNVEKDSSVFIYYSGHGAPNPKTGDAYLVPYDGDPSFIEETGYPLKRLYAKLDMLQVKEIIVVLDSCFSGAGGRSVLAKGARPLVMNMDKQVFHSDRIAILTASAGNQISSTHEEKGHGLFTYFLLKGIKEGNAELGTLYNYLKPQVERIARKIYNNEQTPGLIAPKGLLNLRLYDR